MAFRNKIEHGKIVGRRRMDASIVCLQMLNTKKSTHFQFGEGIEMNTTIDSNSEALDYALVQCLRLFAQLGRKIRTQKLLSEHIPLVKMEDTKDLNDKEPIQK